MSLAARADASTPASGRLLRLARRRGGGRGEPAPRPETERCGLCAEPVPVRHRHVVDRSTGDLECACQACSILFDREAAGGDHYVLVPDDRRRLAGFELDEAEWSALGVPVGLAYFVERSRHGSVGVSYPSPGGLVEADVDGEVWARVLDANPVLGSLRPDVEGLLIRRVGDADEQWLLPVDDCYRLIARFRTHWRGLSGGDAVWEELEEFFDELAERSRTIDSQDEEEHHP